ncbi:DNA repair protein RecN [Blautia sp. 2744]|uniref:DNA repair protein RecN n=3 Tax=Blautia TaxID=572511 RepID=D4LX87_9FIRM|nr:MULTISPECIES: DNA repair protein RecN [Blautia]MBC5740969.1 DNA repair protein RecN [Blautia intestinalis]RHA46985.1 DNA repair protein RecN [Blautia obeum]RHD34229.1 DNA repair protein RecN [Blautia obeum]RHE40568.1 DNA repair protein RecN [Blautia obeum]CBL22240.1 DNA replication and repair protein RecN [Blautia obeum A2-162]
MLVHLHVRNLALIEDIEVEFGPGLNILTGETGAGKSILLGSMQLILGGRSAKDMIRTGASNALVELLFQVENPRAEASLRELGVETSEGQVLLTRKLMDGRSINKINGETCTVAQMKAAASCLLDIHGQHEHQSLLYQDKQLEILDIYGKEEIFPAKEKVQTAYKKYRDCKRQLDELDIDEEQRNRERAFLEFEINEIESAQLVSGEDEELEKRYRKLNNGRKILETLQGVRDLTGYESGQGAGESVGNAVREISRVTEYDAQLDSMASALQEIDGLLNDFNRELASYVDDLNFDDEAFYETEKRLDTINGLKAKYGRTIEDIQEYCLKQKQKLENLDKYEERFHEAEENLKKSREELETVSHKLSVIRQKYSQMLTDKITEGLKDLNFLDVQFQITFRRRKEYTAGGFDDIEYEISTNPGESLKPLGKIVSGGELSRIMLAIKAILADRDQIETLIFDEIDTGISGRTAQKVSEKMALIGRCHQVLCITHLPQIAAMADTHFEIEKHQKDNETITEIHPLEGDDSVRELARLLGGAELTQAVFDNAKEMKELAQVHKNTRLK